MKFEDAVKQHREVYSANGLERGVDEVDLGVCCYLTKLWDNGDCRNEYRPYVILIGGGSCSGKTTLAKLVSKRFLKNRNIESIIISMDDFYIGQREMKLKGLGKNFDDISAIDIPILRNVLRNLRSGSRIIKPKYNFTFSEREGYELVEPAPLIIVEGLYALHHWVSEFGDYRVFIDSNHKTVLDRRIRRDKKERGYKGEDIRQQFLKSVWLMYKEYVLPTKAIANGIVHN